MVGVLEVAADGASGQEAVDEVVRVESVAVEQVSGDGEVDGGRDAADGGEHVVDRRAGVVGHTEGGRDRRARGGYRSGADGGHPRGAGRVPHVDEDERLATAVEAAQLARSAFGRSPWTLRGVRTTTGISRSRACT